MCDLFQLKGTLASELVSIPKFGLERAKFSIPKREILCKVKENKHLRGGVLEYAAQENVKFDAEIVQKGRFGMKTI